MNRQLALAFFIGIAGGAVLAANWKTVAKAGIKAGIRGGRKVRDISQQIIDDFEDTAAEAAYEIGQREQAREPGQSAD
jgi:carbon monoxide dehydrogenase subunit G